MQTGDVQALLDRHFSQSPGYDANTAAQLASTVASAAGVVSQIAKPQGAPVGQPSAKQQACYAQCEKTRDAALAAAAAKGWPMGAVAAAAAVMQFNACRHECDQNP